KIRANKGCECQNLLLAQHILEPGHFTAPLGYLTVDECRICEFAVAAQARSDISGAVGCVTTCAEVLKICLGGGESLLAHFVLVRAALPGKRRQAERQQRPNECLFHHSTVHDV